MDKYTINDITSVLTVQHCNNIQVRTHLSNILPNNSKTKKYLTNKDNRPLIFRDRNNRLYGTYLNIGMKNISVINVAGDGHCGIYSLVLGIILNNIRDLSHFGVELLINEQGSLMNIKTIVKKSRQFIYDQIVSKIDKSALNYESQKEINSILSNGYLSTENLELLAEKMGIS